MIKNIEQKSEIVKAGADAISGIISCINPIFSTVPLLTFAINRVIGLISEKDIIKRIRKLEIKLKEKLITPDQFKEKVGKLTEHNRYVVSNNLNNILLSCITNPEDDSDEDLQPIPGTPPDLLKPPVGCPFYARCQHAMKICKEQLPETTTFSPTHQCACWLIQAKEASHE